MYKYVLSLCQNPVVAEDITQETFLKALKNIDHFKGDCQLRVWLCHIAKNTYFSFYQKNYRLDELSDDIEIEGFESKLIHKESRFEIHKAIHHFQEPYKEVISLRVFGET